MQRILWVFVLAATFAGTGRGQTAPSDTASAEQAKKEVLKLEEERMKALQTVDVAVLDRIYSDTLVYTSERGQVLTKAQRLADLQSGKRRFNSVVHDDVRVDVYGDTVIITGHSTSSLVYNGQTATTPRRFVYVYVKQGGQWRIVNQQETPIIQ